MSNMNQVIDTSILLKELKDANQEMGQVIQSIRQIAQHKDLIGISSTTSLIRHGSAKMETC